MLSQRPLAGIKVVDLTHHFAGSYCGMLLADWGADVIKVEEPGVGDSLRQVGTLFRAGESALFLEANRGKRSITVDIRTEDGQTIVRRLAADADVFVQNFRPGTMQKYGLAYEALSESNKGLVYCSISAFGQIGPYSGKAGLDPVIQAVSGLMSLTGEPDRTPSVVGVPLGDTLGASAAFQGILLALLARVRNGHGAHVCVSLLDAMIAALAPRDQIYFVAGVAPGRSGSASPTFAPYQAVACRDGHVVVAAVGEKFWNRLIESLNLSHLGTDHRFVDNASRVQNREALVSILESVTRELTIAELEERLDTAGIPCGPINDLEKALNHPQVRQNGMVVSVEHPVAGTVPMLGSPIEMSGEKIAPTASPVLGAHTDTILQELGYSADLRAELRSRRII